MNIPLCVFLSSYRALQTREFSFMKRLFEKNVLIKTTRDFERE